MQDRHFNDLFFQDGTGASFEDDVINMLKSLYNHKPSAFHTKDVRHTDLDKKQGTDFLVGEIRFDATLNFFNKDNMPLYSDTGVPAVNYKDFKLGIRHGNAYKGHTDFETPVIVLGIDISPETYKRHWDVIIDNLKNNIQTIILKACDMLESYTCLDPKEREELFETDMKPNSHYTEPTNIKKEYAIANRLHIPDLPDIDLPTETQDDDDMSL